MDKQYNPRQEWIKKVTAEWERLIKDPEIKKGIMEKCKEAGRDFTNPAEWDDDFKKSLYSLCFQYLSDELITSHPTFNEHLQKKCEELGIDPETVEFKIREVDFTEEEEE